jgi:hypothetical protein
MAKGFIYILRNEAIPGLLKIGYSVKFPEVRVDELFTTGVPEPFKLAYYCIAENADKLEPVVHRTLSPHRHRNNREFFRVELEAAVQSIKNLCEPEYEWFEMPIQPKAQSVSQSTASDQQVPFYGINVTSRHCHEGEEKQMVNFVEAAHQQFLTQFVRSLFYDSNSCCCYFELTDEVEPYSSIANKLLEIALETIEQFEWFGQIQHGRNLQHGEF